MEDINDIHLKNLAHNITYLRKKYGISKKAMAKLLGIGIHSLNMLEKGEIPPLLNVGVIIGVQKYFHIRPRDMLETRIDE